jgi:hypothetical protein
MQPFAQVDDLLEADEYSLLSRRKEKTLIWTVMNRHTPDRVFY